MKFIYVLFVCLCTTTFCFAQKTSQELASHFIKITNDNNVEGYKKLFPTAETLSFYIRGIDANAKLDDQFFKTAYLKGVNDAVASFSELQDVLSQKGIDLKKATVTKTETKANDIDMSEGGQVNGVAKTTTLNIHFTAGNQKYVLTIPSAIEVKGQWYVSGEPYEVASEN